MVAADVKPHCTKIYGSLRKPLTMASYMKKSDWTSRGRNDGSLWKPQTTACYFEEIGVDIYGKRKLYSRLRKPQTMASYIE